MGITITTRVTGDVEQDSKNPIMFSSGSARTEFAPDVEVTFADSDPEASQWTTAALVDVVVTVAHSAATAYVKTISAPPVTEIRHEEVA